MILIRTICLRTNVTCLDYFLTPDYLYFVSIPFNVMVKSFLPNNLLMVATTASKKDESAAPGGLIPLAYKSGLDRDRLISKKGQMLSF